MYGTMSDMASTDARYQTMDWRRVRRWVIDRDLGLCQIRRPKCTHFATEADHIVAVVEGGDFYDPANLRAACRMCNAGAGSEVRNRRRYRDSVARYVSRF
jgi:5-methylcytosine-specific restriction endonuclease McrA